MRSPIAAPRLGILGGMVAAVLLAVTAAGASVWITWEAGLLDREGRTVTGIIVAKRHVPARAGMVAGPRRAETWSVTYRFTLEGMPFQRGVSVSPERFAELAPGQSLSVRYLPTDPTVSEIDTGWTRANGLWAAGVAIFFLAVALLIGFILRRFPVGSPRKTALNGPR